MRECSSSSERSRQNLNVAATRGTRKKASSPPFSGGGGRVFHMRILAISTGQSAKYREKPRQERFFSAFPFDKGASRALNGGNAKCPGGAHEQDGPHRSHRRRGGHHQDAGRQGDGELDPRCDQRAEERRARDSRRLRDLLDVATQGAERTQSADRQTDQDRRAPSGEVHARDGAEESGQQEIDTGPGRPERQRAAVFLFGADLRTAAS